jgi:hypothetical protein
LTERLKNVLTKLIHPDQKGFVKGRNISEANRMIQDIIQYADEENEVSIIQFSKVNGLQFFLYLPVLLPYVIKSRPPCTVIRLKYIRKQTE